MKWVESVVHTNYDVGAYVVSVAYWPGLQYDTGAYVTSVAYWPGLQNMTLELT